MSTISIIGTGGMATAIGALAGKAGHRVEVVSRDPSKAKALAEKIGPDATTATFDSVPQGDVVILAVPYAAAGDVIHHYGERLAGKILVDITNPVRPDLTGFVVPEDSAGALEIAKAVPSASVVKAFNTQFSHILAAGTINGQALDVFLAGDDAEAKASVAAFVESLGLRALDTGALAMARTLEHMCLLSLGLMAHSLHHTRFAIGVTTAA